MSADDSLDLGLGLLDHQLVDRDGRRCGNVDDLELEGFRNGKPHVTAILVGPPVWKGRGWLGRLAALITPGGTVRVRWEEVEKVDAAVHLRKTARELGLGRGDDRARKWVEWIPGS
jgi:sporulation protein YlmC with PRC-barrel domain